jgi:peptide/nickel transport system substrate-binding protein
VSNISESLRLLAQDGFHRSGNALRDRDGNAVEFSVLTNSGNKVRERLASLIQADLAQIGIQLNVVMFDFPALLQRITKTFDYESCLLGLVNSDLDPNGQMNVWLSSGSNHAWNPRQTSPATKWESEIDALMAAQATESVPARRKVAFDRVQAISGEENPALYLITKHSLTAFGPAVVNPSPSVLFPQAFWNADQLYLREGSAAKLRKVAIAR